VERVFKVLCFIESIIKIINRLIVNQNKILNTPNHQFNDN
jgi:hypothetical protein